MDRQTRRPKSSGLPAALLVALAAVLATPAEAHWCHDLWGSSYNIVVKPAADTVSVPAAGSATLDVYVQKNMGYPLINFQLRADAAGYGVSVSSQAPTRAGYLLPGESLRHTLTLTSAAGGTLSAQSLNFYVDFGEGAQDQVYGGGYTGARHAVLRTTAGTLRPARPVSVPQADPQALHLGSSAKADYADLPAALDELVAEFCAGRGSWDTNGGANNTSSCSGSATTCPPRVTRGHTKYDYQHLWASFELAYRKASLGSRAAVLRERLRCATNDASPSFKYFPLAMLGYLGEDPATRSFLQAMITSGTTTADEKAAAKAALLLLGSAADATAYRADVTAALASSNAYVSALAATALGIVDGNDTAVAERLIPRASWVQPDTADNGLGFYAAHLLNLVAWSRRGWATDAAYANAVSFYSTVADTTPPRSPAGIACTAQTGGTVRLSWNAVALDTAGAPESVQSYRVYRGTTARPAGATRPGEQGFSYDHLDTTTALTLSVSSLSGTQLQYFTVTAVDSSGNASTYGAEVSCLPRYAPVASVACTPASGVAPHAVTCDSSASSDPNGAADIVGRAWRLDGTAQDGGVSLSTVISTPGSHVVQLTVTDTTGLAASAQANVVVTSPDGGNTPPAAVATALPDAGPAPLDVQLSSAGSRDVDPGQTLSYRWEFDDGTAASSAASPTHRFASPGVYDVALTVTDDGAPPASATATVRVTVTGNAAPDLSGATVTPLAGVAPLTVRFDATGAVDPDGHAMQFTWRFGDGAGDATGISGEHIYLDAGTYAVRLSATDDGLPALPAPVTRDFTVDVRVPGAQNRPPDCAAATVTPASGDAPLRVILDASGCVDPDGEALTFEWRVPRSYTTEDTFTDARVETTLTSPGTVEISLRVRDAAASPLVATRSFPVEVRSGADESIVGGFSGCAAVPAPAALLALSLFAVARLRRQRRGTRDS